MCRALPVVAGGGGRRLRARRTARYLLTLLRRYKRATPTDKAVGERSRYRHVVVVSEVVGAGAGGGGVGSGHSEQPRRHGGRSPQRPLGGGLQRLPDHVVSPLYPAEAAALRRQGGTTTE